MRIKRARRIQTKNLSSSPSDSEGKKAFLSAEKMLGFIFDNMVQGVIVLDAHNRIILANRIAVRRSGLPRARLLNSTIQDLNWNMFHADGSPIAPDEMPSSIVRRTGRSVTDVIVGLSMPQRGIFRWISVNAVPKFNKDRSEIRFILLTISDISERMKAEEQIKMLMYSIDVHRDGFYWADKDSRIVYINHAACSNLGYTREELLGKSIAFIDPRQSAESIKHTWHNLRTHGSHSFETVHRRKDGAEIPVEVNLTRLQFRGKEYVIGYGRDITERIRAEQEKARLEDQIRQSQRMESIGRLAGGLAHDFNNLLTAISGHISLALMDLDPLDPLCASLVEANKAAESAAGLTRQLLTLSRSPVLNIRRIDLNGLIEDLHKMLKRLIGDNIKLKVLLKAANAQIDADPRQIEQIIINLAINARDAMPGGGELTIETKSIQVKEGEYRAYPNAEPGRYVNLAVKDTGHGISEEVKKHLFEPFYTTKEVGKGTGLGLAIVYGAVVQNRGFIDVYSKIGSGTAFNIFFPSSDDKSPVGWKREMENEDLPTGSETIVLVEDNKIVRSVTLKLLKRLGYTVLAYSNGDKAFLDLRSFALPFQLLMTDVIMRGMNGRLLAEKLSALRPNLKVLFTSGYGEDLIAHHGVLDHEVSFIAKPYSPKDLAKKIREVLDGG